MAQKLWYIHYFLSDDDILPICRNEQTVLDVGANDEIEYHSEEDPTGFRTITAG